MPLYKLFYEYFDSEDNLIRKTCEYESINVQTAWSMFWSAEWWDDLGRDCTITRIERCETVSEDHK